MKKRMLRLLSLLLIPILLLLFSAFCLPAQYSHTYLAALVDKAKALKNAQSPRVILVGGSGTAFQADCELLETLLPGRRAVNFGLYAELGTAVMLELCLPDVQSGDIVVFSPELSGQTLSDWFGAESMWQAAEEAPALLARLDASRWEAMLAAFPRYAAQKARFFLFGGKPEGNGVYARAAFTDRGDIRPSLRSANQMIGGWDANMPLRFDPSLPTEELIARVNAFASACEKKGAKLYFRFCPMNADAMPEEEKQKAAAFTAQLQEQLRCDILGSADRALMASGWFYDTNFHLNGAGAQKNTLLLAQELAQALGVDLPASLPEPTLPEAEDAFSPNGEKEDEACFVYDASQPGALIITGLTEEGKAREALAVPAHHSGLPVLSFTADAFAGNHKLRELTIQSNIRAIPDGAFRDCDSLTAIVLLQEEPSRCAVGKDLLLGTSARVLVPEGRYGSYCTDYFWAPHAARLQPIADLNAPSPTPAPTESPAPKRVWRIRYEGNGGTVRGQEKTSLSREITYAHRRENTLQGTVWFQREGWLLTGWSTEKEGGGLSVGLGSRIDPHQAETLYAQWLPCAPDEDFSWAIEGQSAVITGYRGKDAVCVLPEAHDGLPVRVIRAGAFADRQFSRLVLSPSLRTVEAGAFVNCEIQEMLLYDSLREISDFSFSACALPRTLRINAAVSPAYSGSYFDAFQDKYDYLLSLRGKKKLVLSSGSSGRYGYASPLLKEAFPDLEPVNMGVYAYTSALPQLQLILPQMEEGDILLYSPEFDAVQEQFCVSSRLDAGFWAMMESNYDTASMLDMRAFSGVFDSLGEYLRVRARMPARDYALSPAHFDDDGNAYDFSTYNQYGDFILPRPLGDTDERLRHNIADYTANSFPPETVQCLNAALAPFTEKGVSVYFTYTPRNVNSLTEESTLENRAALHEHLKAGLSVPVISEIEDSLLPGRYFWLIDSHTGDEGAIIRTRRVIRDLEHVLHPISEPQEERSPGS